MIGIPKGQHVLRDDQGHCHYQEIYVMSAACLYLIIYIIYIYILVPSINVLVVGRRKRYIYLNYNTGLVGLQMTY